MKEETGERIFSVIKLALGGLLLILSLFLPIGENVKIIIRIAAALITGYEIIIKSVKNLLKLEFFDENALMLIAAVTAFIIGESAEGVFIILLYNLGELLEDIATDRSREKIAGLAELKSTKANLFLDGKVVEVDPKDVEIGSLILVRKGDRVPIDGVIFDGSADFDLKAVTGETKLYSLSKGEKVYSGGVNLGEAVVIKTEKLFKDSTVEKIIEMVETSTERKAKSQKFITSFAKIYTPCVVISALLLAIVPPLFDGYNFTRWIYKALSFLIISCPCALVISVPLGFFIGIGSLAKRGVLVKGSNYVDALSKVKTAVFDKTGTLTTGEFVIGRIIVHNGYSEKEVLKIAASVEQGSSHPIAKALTSNVEKSALYIIKDLHEIAGKGVSAEIDGEKFEVGNIGFVKSGEPVLHGKSENNIIFVTKNGVLIGEIELTDRIKDDADKLVETLCKAGVNKTVVLSGDKKTVAERVGKELNIDKVYAELLPEQKTEKLAGILEQKQGNVLYCGDGINDSPSIAAADVGVAMGVLGSEAAIDCADVIITDDNLLKIPYAVKKSKLIKRKVITNIVGSIAVKVAIMALSVFTPLPIWLAMFADVGVMLLAVLNSLTISLYK